MSERKREAKGRVVRIAGQSYITPAGAGEAPSPERGATNERRSRVVRIGGQEFMAAPAAIPSPSPVSTPAANEDPEPEPEREPWRSPPIRVENADGGQWVARFEDVLPGSAANEGTELAYMPVPQIE